MNLWEIDDYGLTHSESVMERETKEELRRQVDELATALRELVDIVDGVVAREGSLDSFTTQPGHTALACVGSECEMCEYSQLNTDGGHCYMFKEKPVGRCAQWKLARARAALACVGGGDGGGGEEEIE